MKPLSILAVVAFAFVGTAKAQEGTCPTPGCELAETVFGSIEENPNGMIDMGEFVYFGESIFISMDSNKSSTVDFDEFTAWDFGFNFIAEERGQQRAYATAQKILFSFWDRNGNKEISRQEFHQSMSSDFRRADADNDAFLTREEFLLGYITNIAYRAAIEGN